MISHQKNFLEHVKWLTSEHARLAAELAQSASHNRGLVAEFSRLQRSLEAWRSDEHAPLSCELAKRSTSIQGGVTTGVVSLDDLMDQTPLIIWQQKDFATEEDSSGKGVASDLALCKSDILAGENNARRIPPGLEPEAAVMNLTDEDDAMMRQISSTNPSAIEQARKSMMKTDSLAAVESAEIDLKTANASGHSNGDGKCQKLGEQMSPEPFKDVSEEMRQRVMSLMARSNAYDEQEDHLAEATRESAKREKASMQKQSQRSTTTTKSGKSSAFSSAGNRQKDSLRSRASAATSSAGLSSVTFTKIGSKFSDFVSGIGPQWIRRSSGTGSNTHLQHSASASQSTLRHAHSSASVGMMLDARKSSAALSVDPRLQGATVIRNSGTKENLLFDDQSWKVQNIKTGSILRSQGPLQKMVSAPGAKHRVCWDLIGAALVIYDIIMIPFTQVFEPQEEPWMETLTWIGAIFWLIDMPKSFFSGFHRRGVVEMRMQKVVQNYLKTWFLFDVVVLLIDWMFLISKMEMGGSSTADGGGAMRMMRSGRWLRALRILRACRLIRLARVYRILNSFFNSFSTELLRVRLQAFAALLGIVVLNHLIACIWYSVGKIPSKRGRNWIEFYDLDKRDVGYRYLTALHWALTQCTPASMEIFPVNAYERAVAVCTMVFGLFTFSSFISAITQKMTQLFMLTHDRLCQNVNMRRYFAENGLSLEVTEKVLDFFEFKMHDSQKRIHEKDIPILKVLPERIRIQMHVEIFMPCLLWVPFFEYFEELDNTRLRSICHAAVAEQALLPDQELFMKGVQASNVYFINHGRLSYHRRGEECDVEDGTWVSEAALWMNWSHRGRMSAVAMSEIFVLDASVFNVFVSCCSPTSRTWIYCTTYALEFANLDNMSGGHHLSDLCHDFEGMQIMADNAFHKALRHGTE